MFTWPKVKWRLLDLAFNLEHLPMQTRPFPFSDPALYMLIISKDSEVFGRYRKGFIYTEEKSIVVYYLSKNNANRPAGNKYFTIPANSIVLKVHFYSVMI